MTTKTYDNDPLGILEEDNDPLGILDGDSVKKKIGGASPSPSIGTGGDGLSPSGDGSDPFSYKSLIKKPDEDKNRWIKAPMPIAKAVQEDKKKKDSVLGGVFNTVVGSVARLGGGFVETQNVILGAGEDALGRLMGTPGMKYRSPVMMKVPERQEVVDFVEKARTASSSKENEQARSQFDITNGVQASDVKALLFQAPSTVLDMFGGAYSGGTSFFFQSVNDNAKELEENPSATKLTNNEKLSYLFVQGTVQAALEKFGIDKILKATGVSSKVKQKIANEVTDEFIKKGIKATAKDIEGAVLKRVSSLPSQMKRIGTKAATSFAIEGTTEGLQSAASDGIKLLTNKISGNEVFDEEDIAANFIKNTINAAAQGGVFGGGIGGGVGVLSNTKKAIRNEIANATTPEDIQKMQANIAEQVEMGNITPQEAEAANITAQQYAEVAATIPEEIEPEKKYALIGGIEQREQLKKGIMEAQDELVSTDEAFHESIQDRIELMNAKLAQTNDYIDGIATGKKPTYRKEGDGYIKTDSKGETPISKEHYELATAVREEDAVNNKMAEEISKQEIKAAKILGKATLPDAYQVIAEENPIGVVKDIAKQAQNLNEEFEPHNDGKEVQSLQRAKEVFGEETVNEAIALYPKKDTSPSMETTAEGQKEGATEGVVPSTLEIPENLKDKGEQVASNEDAKRRFSEGERIFAFSEQDETPIELRSVEQMDKYASDQLLAYPEQQSSVANEAKETTTVPDTPEATGAATGTPNQTGGATEEGGAIPPTEPPITESAAAEDDKQPERRFTKQMLRSDEVSETSKGEIAKTLNYVQQTNDMSIKEANEIIDYVGLDEALNVVIGESGIKPVIRVVLGQILIKKYNELADAASNQADRYYYLDKTIQVANFVTERLATEAGQQIQAFSLWSRLSPEGQLRAATNDLGGPARDRLRRREGDINKIGNKFQKANEEAADEITKSDEVKESTKKDDNEKIEKAKDKISKAKEKRANIIKKWKGRKGGNLFSSPLGLTPDGIEFVGDVAKTYIEEGVANVEILVQKVIQHLEDVAGKKVNDVIRKQVTDEADKILEKADTSLLGKQLKEKRIKIAKIVKEHYTVVDKAKKTLTQKFMDDADMSQSNAEELSKKVQAAFDRVATRKKRNILYHEKARFDKINKTLKGSKTPEQKTVADDIIKYSNLGAFENTDLRDMIADKFGLGQLTPDQAAKLKELAEKIQKAPEGSPKRDATEDLLAYRAKLKGNDLMETVQAVWYANILSGYKTHEKNVVSTFFNTMFEIGAEMAKDPKAIPYLTAGYLNGVFRRGAVEARHTLATGRSPIHIKKIETPSTLERKTFKYGAINPGNWFKYVSRLMVAEDVLNFQGLKEARARQLARKVAQSEGFNTWSKKGWDRVNEILFHTKERMNEAKLQADEEGLKGVEKKRRVYELMEESRPLKMTEDAYGFAAHGTFNHESEGSLGALTNAVAQALDAVNVGGAKPLRFIVPFTRIITNVVNNSLDFTPVGLVRAARGVRGVRSFEDNRFTKGAFKELTKEERQRLIAKASIGIALAATFQALHVAGIITITGGGPDDEKKKKQLQQSGWQEYSIKVGDKWYSYKYTPLIFVTGFLGNMNDAEEYATTEKDKTMQERMELAAWRIGGQVADMTWINSASTFLGGLTEKTPDQAAFKLSSAFTNMGKGFIPFRGAIDQGSQLIQNIYNMPQKQVNNAWQSMIQDIPIAKNSLNDKINALGDPIVRDIDVFSSKETTDPVWKFLLDHKGWVAPVNRNTIIVIDKGTQLERPVTGDEYYEFSKLRGQKIKAGILNLQKNGYYFDIDKPTKAEDMSEAQLNKVLSKIETQATKDTKAEMFGEKEPDYEKEAIEPVIDILNKYNN